jgi:8-oxo-dGTP diphosphatase
MTWSAENSAGYASPVGLTADVVVLTVREGRVVVLALGAGPSPANAGAQSPADTAASSIDEGRAGDPASATDDQAPAPRLPGGFVGPDEAPLDTARRKLAEKTGLTDLYLEQLGAFAAPDRDPRGWIPTVAHLALVPPGTEADDPAADWIDARAEHAWAFDHAQILAAALDRVEGKLWWSNVCVGILPGPFTLAEARGVYGAIAQVAYDPGSFSRDLRATGLIEPTGEERRAGAGRPAALYRFASRDPAWGAGRRKRVRG